MTPLAPSVEKAYYRKCIQLKRRLNEVEAANDETKARRMRLDRAIMKMRLERAFLLDELRKRMDHNVDDTDGSGDEGMVTPPTDRPHRDKRRRPHQGQPAAPSAGPPANTFQIAAHSPSAQRTASDPNGNLVPGPGGHMVAANLVTEDGRYIYVDPTQQPATHAAAAPPSQPPALPHGSPYGPPPTGMPGVSATNGMDIDGPNGQARDHGTSREQEHGERRATPSPDDTVGESQDSGRMHPRP